MLATAVYYATLACIPLAFAILCTGVAIQRHQARRTSKTPAPAPVPAVAHVDSHVFDQERHVA